MKLHQFAMLELHPPPSGSNLERAETIDVLVTLLSEHVSIEADSDPPRRPMCGGSSRFNRSYPDLVARNDRDLAAATGHPDPG
ncbi:MAG: hypothetical protein M3N32_05615, partial [Actinomycetota bacterium]|nr:hypothetical protein [Actinomycetota bacterium]